MEDWYVLYTKPHSERQVEEALTAKGIETFYPSLPAPKRKGRPSTRPYFPCYLFARCNLEEVGISRINWTPGMRHLVAFGGLPARMDGRVLERIRERLAQPHVIDEQGEFLEPGDRVVITTGPLRDIEAVFDRRLTGQGRARVLVQLLQRWAACEVETTELKKIGRGTEGLPAGKRGVFEGSRGAKRNGAGIWETGRGEWARSAAQKVNTHGSH